MTQWQPVVGYEGLYEVSREGRVRSLDRVKRNRWGEYVQPGVELRASSAGDGYAKVALTKDGKLRTRRVHILVLEAFVGRRPDGMQACHNDGNQGNNCIENLRWDTVSANTYDKIRHGTHVQAAQTHCKRGHPFSGPGSHVSIRPDGRRRCRTCENENQQSRRRAT